MTVMYSPVISILSVDYILSDDQLGLKQHRRPQHAVGRRLAVGFCGLVPDLTIRQPGMTGHGTH